MTELLSEQIFSPKEADSPSDVLVVMPNEMGAALPDYHGARAQDVADETGHHVLAYERRFSGQEISFNWGDRRRMRDEAVNVFSRTAAALDKVIEREGPNRVYMAGHSAATFDVFGVPRSERTEFHGLVATDPPGMRRAGRFAEITDYVKYQVFDERKKPEPTKEEEYTNTQELNRVTMPMTVARRAGELIVYGGYGSSPESLRLLKDLIDAQRQLPIALVFPEKTFTADRQQQVAIKRELESMRGEGQACVDVELLEGGYHSRFDDYKLFGRTVLDKIDSF